MTAELACAVLSFRDEPFLIEAVSSVLDQGLRIEVVVVNSGGGDPAPRLAAAGIDVPVYNFAERRYPGGVRNVGIDATNAPYLAFLAADCLAAPGWAAARLRAHRAGAAAVASAMTNAHSTSLSAWAAFLLLHNRRLAATRPKHRLLYSMSYDRGVFERFGRFREDLRAGEDTEFNARIQPHVRTEFAADAITAHRYPTQPSAMLADAFRRGRLQACMQGAIEQRATPNLRVAARGPLGVLRAIGIVGRTPGPQRGVLLRSLPLVVAGSLAYTAGALTARNADVPNGDSVDKRALRRHRT